MTEATCPSCGNTFEVPEKRHNKRGQGYYAAKKMTKLGDSHKEVLSVLDGNFALDYGHGRTLSDITFLVNALRKGLGKKNLKDQTVSARLSELQGLGILSCAPADVILADRATMQFVPENKPKWYRVASSLIEST